MVDYSKIAPRAFMFGLADSANASTLGAMGALNPMGMGSLITAQDIALGLGVRGMGGAFGTTAGMGGAFGATTAMNIARLAPTAALAAAAVMGLNNAAQFEQHHPWVSDDFDNIILDEQNCQDNGLPKEKLV